MYKNVIPEFDKIPEVTESHFTTVLYVVDQLFARDTEHLHGLLNIASRRYGSG